MKKLFFSLLALSTIILFSCNKEDGASLISSEEEAIVLNDAATETVMESADYEIDLFSGSTESINDAATGLKSTEQHPFWGRYRLGQAPTVILETTDGDFPKTITLDYGEGTELNNGTVISGQIIIVVSAPPRTDGATREVTFNDFYVDSVNIAGTRNISFSANDEEGITFTVVGDLVFTFTDGTYIERHAEKIRKLVEGYATFFDHSDDVLHITGYTSAVSSEGYSFSKTIIEPLVRLGTCRYIVSGIVVMEKNDEVFAELDFGDGTCDDIATIVKDGEERQITLGKRHRIRNQHQNN
jgi:hypothetical protein